MLRTLRAAANFLLALGAAGFGVSCGPDLVYEARQEMPGVWTYADTVAFDYEIADTTRAYDLSLGVEHSTAFATENLYAKFVTRYPNGEVQEESVSLALADAFGNWLGDCAGDRCELKVPLQDSARFPAPGRYGLTLRQYMRQDSVEGPLAIGLRITGAE